MRLDDPKYIYADILIALAYADEDVDARERELLDGMFEQMGLDVETVQKMWLTPRTPDVVESILQDLQDESFKRCLIKDCYLLAFADQKIDPEESKFIREVSTVMQIDADTVAGIREWVKTAIDQKQKALELFGEEEEA